MNENIPKPGPRQRAVLDVKKTEVKKVFRRKEHLTHRLGANPALVELRRDLTNKEK